MAKLLPLPYLLLYMLSTDLAAAPTRLMAIAAVAAAAFNFSLINLTAAVAALFACCWRIQPNPYGGGGMLTVTVLDRLRRRQLADAGN